MHVADLILYAYARMQVVLLQQFILMVLLCNKLIPLSDQYVLGPPIRKKHLLVSKRKKNNSDL